MYKIVMKQSDFDKVALVDYGLAYEDMAKDEYFHKTITSVHIFSYSA